MSVRNERNRKPALRGAVVVAVALLAGLISIATTAGAGQIWTDTNGDGAPDPPYGFDHPSTVVTVDVWLDSQSFQFQTYAVWAEWSTGCSYVPGSGSHLVTGCALEPIDRVSHPSGIGFSGAACLPPRHGVIRIGRYQLHVDGYYNCCTQPIIDPSHPYNIFTLVNNGLESYMLFETEHGSCFTSVGATEESTWGRVKGLYH